MSDTINDTIAGIKKALAGSPLIAKADTVQVSTGFVPYDLQAPAKNLYPVHTPLRNLIPRVPAIGTATYWKVVTGIAGSGYKSMGWVAEGTRTPNMSLTLVDRSASWKTFGEESDVTFEAEESGQGFEDVVATSVIRTLQQVMLKEEQQIIGGNNSVALGTPTAPTVTKADTGGTVAIKGSPGWTAKVVALTYEGYRAWFLGGASQTSLHAQATTFTGNDSKTYTVNGGTSQASNASVACATTASTSVLYITTPVVTGAVAYAWFVDDGAGGGTWKLEAITTINSVTLTAIAGTGTSAAGYSADKSQNTLAYDGLMYAAFGTAFGTGAYIKNMATGTPGTGTALTASGRGSIVEIDDMLESMFKNYLVSPKALWMSAGVLKDVINKTLTGNSSSSLLRYNTQNGPYNLVAGGGLVGYYNPFSVDGQNTVIPINVHPYLPEGMIMAWTDALPPQYQNNEVPRVAEMRMVRDYYEIQWPLRTRAREYGVYARGAFVNYAPFCTGMIVNIATS